MGKKKPLPLGSDFYIDVSTSYRDQFFGPIPAAGRVGDFTPEPTAPGVFAGFKSVMLIAVSLLTMGVVDAVFIEVLVFGFEFVAQMSPRTTIITTKIQMAFLFVSCIMQLLYASKRVPYSSHYTTFIL